jgi:hypothetical protein
VVIVAAICHICYVDDRAMICQLFFIEIEIMMRQRYIFDSNVIDWIVIYQRLALYYFYSIIRVVSFNFIERFMIKVESLFISNIVRDCEINLR